MKLFLFFILLSTHDGEKAFKEAKEHFEKGRLVEARKGFQNFIQRYSKNTHLPEALYYRGRLSRNPERAIDSFQEVLSRFPNSSIADEALFLVSKYHDAKGDLSQSKETLLKLLKNYPDTNHKGEAEELLGDTSRNLPIPRGGYTVQVGSFGDEEQAQGLRERLMAKGYSVSITLSIIEGKSFHRVRVGAFATREEALKMEEVLKEKEGLTPWVVKNN